MPHNTCHMWHVNKLGLRPWVCKKTVLKLRGSFDWCFTFQLTPWKNSLIQQSQSVKIIKNQINFLFRLYVRYLRKVWQKFKKIYNWYKMKIFQIFFNLIFIIYLVDGNHRGKCESLERFQILVHLGEIKFCTSKRTCQ